MPKKRRQTFQVKPQSSVHPSLNPSSRQQRQVGNGSTANAEPPTQVNELLLHLRQAQSRPSTSVTTQSESSSSTPTVTVPLLYPPSQHQVLPELTPRERWQARSRHRRVPGPAAPPSWTQKRVPLKSHLQLEEDASKSAKRMDRLPDISLPARGSLRFMLIRKLATEWHDMRDLYDDEYFSGPGLASHLKQALLAFLAVYGPPIVLVEDIEVLFRDVMLDTETWYGGTDVSHLHLGFVTNPVRDRKGYKGIADLLFGNDYLKSKAGPAKIATSENQIPDSWDVEEEDLTTVAPTLNVKTLEAPRFSSLTHLSLAHAHFASWRFLLRDLTPHLAKLTHLSLAYWPQPSLTPNSRTSTIRSPIGHIDVSATSFYNALDGDWNEAVSVLQQLGKDLLCLRYLDLEGCSTEGGWAKALTYTGSRQIRWAHTFRGLETLIIGQGRTPTALSDHPTRDDFLKDWVSLACAVLSDSDMLDTNPALRDVTYHPMLLAHRRRCGTAVTALEVLHLVKWLEREHEIHSTRQHIHNLRRAAGIVQDLVVVGTPYPKWASDLVKVSDSERREFWDGSSINFGLIRALGVSQDERYWSVRHLAGLSRRLVNENFAATHSGGL